MADALAGKVVVITGASSGIGAALARLLGGRGARLALGARREPELQAVAAASGPRTLAVVTDVRRRADVDRLRDEALRAFGRVDVWVNNAGRGITRPVLDLTDAEVDEVLAVNLKSALYGMQAIVPHFRERGDGHLINVSSFLGRVPFVPTRAAYNAAKAGLNMLSAALRMELKTTHPNVKVTVVLPGVVATDFHRNVIGPGAPPPAGGGRGPHVQTAEEVAAAIAGAIERPVAELYPAPGQVETQVAYYSDVGAFEERLRGGGGR